MNPCQHHSIFSFNTTDRDFVFTLLWLHTVRAAHCFPSWLEITFYDNHCIYYFIILCLRMRLLFHSHRTDNICYNVGLLFLLISLLMHTHMRQIIIVFYCCASYNFIHYGCLHEYNSFHDMIATAALTFVHNHAVTRPLKLLTLDYVRSRKISKCCNLGIFIVEEFLLA